MGTITSHPRPILHRGQHYILLAGWSSLMLISLLCCSSISAAVNARERMLSF